MDEPLLVMLNALRPARPAVGAALARVASDPSVSPVGLRHLEAMCGVLKEDANALVAILIARPGGEDLIAEAEEFLGYFARLEAQVGRALNLMER